MKTRKKMGLPSYCRPTVHVLYDVPDSALNSRSELTSTAVAQPLPIEVEPSCSIPRKVVALVSSG